jgi:hypothetical protein
MLWATNDDMEYKIWNVGWCIAWKVKIGMQYFHRLYESSNGSKGIWKKECSGKACWEGSHYG